MSLRAAYSHLRRESSAVFSPFNMTSDQYVLLFVLEQTGEATQQELVKRCYSDTATIGAMVALLETKGLLKRTPHPRDRRARSVKLTRAGTTLAREMSHASAALRARIVALFQDEELRAFISLLDRLAEAMQPPSRNTRRARRRRPTRAGEGNSQ